MLVRQFIVRILWVRSLVRILVSVAMPDAVDATI
jgi:hypothetical protein